MDDGSLFIERDEIMTWITSALKRIREALCTRRALSSWPILWLALFCLAVSGYYMMYHFFFQGIGIDKLAADRHEAPIVEMKYDGVQYFRARRVTPDEPLDLTVYSIPEFNAEKGSPQLELFIELELSEGTEFNADQEVATLVIEQEPRPGEVHTSTVPLRNVHQQRITTDWLTYTPGYGDTKSTKVVPNAFRAQIDLTDTSQVESILIGTKIHANLLGYAWPWLLAGILLFALWASAGKRWSTRSLWLLIGAFAVLLFFRVGTFISNDFFLDTSGKAAVFKTSFGHWKRFAASLEWYPHVYKMPGHFLVPFLTTLIEPFSVATPTSTYVYNYPLPRYLWFLLECAGFLTLTLAVFRYLSPRAAIIFPFVYATFPPILFDIYNMEDDALLIIGMLFLTALLLRMSTRLDLQWKDMLLCSGIMFFMLVSKITGVFLILAIPFGLLAARWFLHRRPAIQRAFMLFALLVAALIGSKITATILRPPAREAQPGFAYQDTNLWDMMWAANGLWDPDTAHPFVKSGRLRDQTVVEHAAEAAGKTVEELFPDQIKRMRHSKIGDELVYKPDLINAWQERPSFFFNQAAIRFWNGTTNFYGYGDRGRYWRLDLDGSHSRILDSRDGGEEIQAHKTGDLGQQGYKTLVLRSRFDDTWKIAPQIYLTSLFNFDRPEHRLINLALLALAMLGIVCMRRLDLAIIFFTCILAKATFNTFIHIPTRYFDWVHVPMLLGLALMLAIVITICWNNSGNILRTRLHS